MATPKKPTRVRVDLRSLPKRRKRKPRTVTVELVFTPAGYAELDTRARARSMRLPQYIRALLDEDADDGLRAGRELAGLLGAPLADDDCDTCGGNHPPPCPKGA